MSIQHRVDDLIKNHCVLFVNLGTSRNGHACVSAKQIVPVEDGQFQLEIEMIGSSHVDALEKIYKQLTHTAANQIRLVKLNRDN